MNYKILLLLTAAAFAFTACGDDDEDSASNADLIVGEWAFDDLYFEDGEEFGLEGGCLGDDTYTFTRGTGDNGTYLYNVNMEADTCTFSRDPEAGQYEIVGDSLILTQVGGMTTRTLITRLNTEELRFRAFDTDTEVTFEFRLTDAD